MTPEHKKKFNTVAGTLFMVMGVLGYAMALYYAFTPNEPPPSSVGQKSAAQVSDASCMAAVRGLQLYVTRRPEGLKITAPLPSGADVSNDAIKALMTKVSLVPLLCERKMSYFCIGADCKDKTSLTMVLPATGPGVVPHTSPEPSKLGSSIKPGSTR